jgi:hypothetical protein
MIFQKSNLSQRAKRQKKEGNDVQRLTYTHLGGLLDGLFNEKKIKKYLKEHRMLMKRNNDHLLFISLDAE